MRWISLTPFQIVNLNHMKVEVYYLLFENNAVNESF